MSLRRGDPFSNLPFIGRDLFVTTEFIAMRASGFFESPSGSSPDGDLVRRFFGLLFGLDPIPAMSKRAALGFGFDYDFQPLAFARVSIGEAVGPIGDNPRASLFAAFGADPKELRAPLDPGATYDWRLSEAQHPSEPTDLEVFARMLF
jgi:hypothetical protein